MNKNFDKKVYIINKIYNYNIPDKNFLISAVRDLFNSSQNITRPAELTVAEKRARFKRRVARLA